MIPKLVQAQDAPEDEPYWAVVFPDGSWMRLSKLFDLVDDSFNPFLLEHEGRPIGRLVTI